MISRVADHCFWLGRYLERAESTARVLAGDGAASRSTPSSPPRRCWQPVVIVAGEDDRLLARASGSDDRRVGDGESVQRT